MRTDDDHDGGGQDGGGQDGGDAATDAHYYLGLAAAYVRGALGAEATAGLEGPALLAAGRAAGLKLHRFKRTAALPRVKRVLGVLQGLAPQRLLDVGSGRGVFLWPLLDAFPTLDVIAVEPDPRRRSHLEAVRAGGLSRLSVLGCDAAALPLGDGAVDVATVLEVLEHQEDPSLIARETARVARRFAIASTPSKADDNPEHIQLFDGARLERLWRDAGAEAVKIDHVLNHVIAVARLKTSNA